MTIRFFLPPRFQSRADALDSHTAVTPPLPPAAVAALPASLDPHEFFLFFNPF
jgi:hypothetical protein